MEQMHHNSIFLSGQVCVNFDQSLVICIATSPSFFSKNFDSSSKVYSEAIYIVVSKLGRDLHENWHYYSREFFSFTDERKKNFNARIRKCW